METVFSMHSRSVVAFEYDPGQRDMSATEDQRNILFVIDDGFTLKKLTENDEGNLELEVLCNLVKAFPQHLADVIYDLRKSEF